MEFKKMPYKTDGIHAWLEELGLNITNIRTDYHLDAAKRDQAVIITLPSTVKVNEDKASHFNHILKEGFRRLSERKGR